MLRLLLSKDWIAVRKEILGRIAADVEAQRGGRILMVPELISHDTERRLCAAAGDTASRFAEVLSFTRLARRVAESAGCAAPGCMDNGGRVVAMAAAARQLHSRLKAYAAVETKPEFLAELVDAVDVPTESLTAALQQMGAAAENYASQLENTIALLNTLYELAPTWSPVEMGDLGAYAAHANTYGDYTVDNSTNVYINGIQVPPEKAGLINTALKKAGIYNSK